MILRKVVSGTPGIGPCAATRRGRAGAALEARPRQADVGVAPRRLKAGLDGLRLPFPALPETPEIMNHIIPDMLQNALTGAMTVDEAAEDAAKKVAAIKEG
ncbi:MAG TPA: hypothetical protein PK420_10015, partial [Rubrivivax sp.]|nr:hypothetical protein [Rubrivivax sp.]